ncbi:MULTISPECIES: type II toxin-antitoxin system HipA family toxin [unclassified Rathayibacter]|uniref:type II toxin-antitoxin system HipA family toxin n=1 Tax=unclassified Rathayibacter TaxID=2609250 RepID=UPI000CE754C5|nr:MULTISPECIES: type II toxin-antitoxin system HipA family toxin [unclassified Rathayibacter]PPG10869.1 phosphatidylinositol kinase [Rathayibacter sp. AY2B1]PPG70158.1 phosphatidylinositol kinase [Rathayibacter sp. AY1F4]
MPSDRVYVWTWLPGSETPVVAGAVEQRGDRFPFVYAASYRSLPGSISLYGPELPLREGTIEPRDGLVLAGALRDGSPDGWGRTVIDERRGARDRGLTELEYMIASGSSRFGALDFQESPTEYTPREDRSSLDELHEAADRLEAGLALSPALDAALLRGTSIGGARPKATLLDDAGVEHIAKFSASSDRTFQVVNAEGAALALARRAGLDVARSRVVSSLGKDVLLVQRFDREGRRRRHAVSALTMSGESEWTARYVSYPEVLDVLRRHGPAGVDPGPELFARIAFNMAISNSDDHARNHAAFWDGRHLTLTPAYDLAPGNRSGETATQALAYSRDGEKRANFASLMKSAPVYGLDRAEGRAVVERTIEAVVDGFDDAVEEARVPERDRELLRGHLFLNPGVLHDLSDVVIGWTAGTPGGSDATRRADPRQRAGSRDAEGRVEG